MYLETFTLPIEREEQLIAARMRENGGGFGYIDNDVQVEHRLHERLPKKYSAARER